MQPVAEIPDGVAGTFLREECAPNEDLDGVAGQKQRVEE
jgi:hypothetical protein